MTRKSSAENGEKDVADTIRRTLVVVALNLPHCITPEQVAELFWTRVGLNVDPADISTQDSGQYCATAFIGITEADLVEFLTRNFETCMLGEQRNAVSFEVKRWKEDNRNSNGIRRLK
jgi:hypothetical protein